MSLKVVAILQFFFYAMLFFLQQATQNIVNQLHNTNYFAAMYNVKLKLLHNNFVLFSSPHMPPSAFEKASRGKILLQTFN